MDDRQVLVIIILIFSHIILTLIGIAIGFVRGKNKANNADEDEIISIVNESHEQGIIEESEATMINNIFEFGDKQAKDIMTDRSNVVAIDGKTRLEDAIEIMLDEVNSRFPVFDESIDHITGILYFKDAVAFNRDKANKKKTLDSIDGLLREAKFIPETRKVDALFSSMRTAKLQMVVVIDEYGQTSGIVSMRDILEEIVGDINDEYDVEDGFIVAKKDNKYIVDGLTPLENIEKYLDIEFDEDNVETLNGFMIIKMEHIPDKKEKFEIDYNGYSFKVLSVENKMVKQVLITKIEDEDVCDTDEESVKE